MPRLINLLCDQSLVYGFSEDLPRIENKTVAEVVLDRARAGLSPFRPLPDGWSVHRLPMETEKILREMRG